MFHRWCMGFILGAGLVAAPPTAPRNQAWMLALDARGGMVGDLKQGEVQVKVDGKLRPLSQFRTPAQTADAAQSWVLVFEPIRDTHPRAAALVAAADLLTKVPEGDRVFMVARGRQSLEALMPGFSASRRLWVEALAKVPEMLPESLAGKSAETLQGAGFQGSFTDLSDGASGQAALTALLTRFKAGVPGWARGTSDQRGINVLDRLNFDNPMLVASMLITISRETKALESLLDLLAPVQGQKHVLVFSRCEADDMSHPSVKRAMTQTFKREKGDLGGPAESATLATRDMTLLQMELKTKAVASGVTLFSVAGAGQNVLGHVGAIAQDTGGFAFPLVPGMETQFGQTIQAFGSRHLVQWAEESPPGQLSPLEISTTRKGARVLAQTLR